MAEDGYREFMVVQSVVVRVPAGRWEYQDVFAAADRAFDKNVLSVTVVPLADEPKSVVTESVLVPRAWTFPEMADGDGHET